MIHLGGAFHFTIDFFLVSRTWITLSVHRIKFVIAPYFVSSMQAARRHLRRRGWLLSGRLRPYQWVVIPIKLSSKLRIYIDSVDNCLVNDMIPGHHVDSTQCMVPAGAHVLSWIHFQ